jgi:hypothetical protein
MGNRLRARSDFLRRDSVGRIDRIAESLRDLGDAFETHSDMETIKDKIDGCSWMIEWAVPEEPLETQRPLVALQNLLSTWRTCIDMYGSRWAVQETPWESARLWAEQLGRSRQ